MSKLLINESPLVLLPSLAKAIGVNQAIVIQQIHYWLQTSKTKINERKWVYNTIDEWHEQFPFFSRSTLERTISSLVKDGILIVEKLSTNKSDRTNYYSIDYVKLNQPLRQNEAMDNIKMLESTITSNCGNGYTENTETTSKNTNNNTAEILSKKSEQDFINKVATDNRKTFPITFDWQPNKTQFAAYCQRKLITPNQLTKAIFDKFVDKVSAKGESKTEAQWCESLASYLQTCINNPQFSNPNNQHIYRPESQQPTSSGYVLPKATAFPESTKPTKEQREKMKADLQRVMGIGV